jgi:uncharacterized protein (TIGR00369 family)
MSLIYKICPEELWRAAERAGEFTGAPVDIQDGFIHFSTASQLAGTAEKHFRGQTGLLLIALDPAVLGEALRYEPSRGGDLFPHLYGVMPLRAVRSVRKLELAPDGHVILPPLDGSPAQPFDPAADGWKTRQETGLVELLGPFWMKAEGEKRLYGFTAEPRHLNQGGVVHGGMLMAFADQALGLTASQANRGRRQVTIQLDTHFLATVNAGEFVIAYCEVVRLTRSLIFMTCELKVTNRVVATASGVWKVLGA